MRPADWSFFLVTALWVVTGCNKSQAVRPQPIQCVCGATNWVKVSIASGGLSALMPGRPTVSALNVETQAGPMVGSLFTSEPSSTVAFSLQHFPFPTNATMPDPSRLYAESLKRVLGADGRLLYDLESSLNGHPGREWSFEKFQRQAVLTIRIFLIGHDLYQAACVMPKGRVCKYHIALFLDSCESKTE